MRRIIPLLFLGNFIFFGCGEFNIANSPELQIDVVSSAPQHVSGGSARVEIHLPSDIIADSVTVEQNGRDVTHQFIQAASNRLEGVLTGLNEGKNTITASLSQQYGPSLSTSATLVNHDITGPIFSGPAQEYFACATEEHRNNALLGEILDNDCSMKTVVSFLYKSKRTQQLEEFKPNQIAPDDIEKTVTIEGDTVDFIVRWERGTINRFIYSIALLSPATQELESPDLSTWNTRLIYYFQGGVGIGRYQGNPSRQRMLYDYGLSKGYAVIYSTGTRTSTHYDLEVGGETAIMVKSRFITAYGTPTYTVGVGGSGGAIQQYVYGQNHPRLLDAAIPQYSYPDMVTQTIHVGDCELLERYMDVESAKNPESKWATWSNRTWLEGMYSSDTVPNRFAGNRPGNTECINGWRGLTPLSFNPHYGRAPGMSLEDHARVEWTHYADLKQIYGVDPDGYARRTWDNVGVQYGLRALIEGQISPEEFIDLNARIGGWKHTAEIKQEGLPYIESGDEVDIHSARNMTLSQNDSGYPPAPRTVADSIAVKAAYNHGLVFTGDLSIPVIDWRHYLEEELDMHNSHQSFSVRQRMLNFDDDASNQVIWFTDITAGKPRFDQTPLAFEVIDEWLANIKESPQLSVAENKPDRALDSCFDAEGNLIYAGTDAWNGILNEQPLGSCASTFPTFTTSRIVAGGPITGDIFKCQLQSIDSAIEKGLYGSWQISNAEKERLQTIFPGGVCDYQQPDLYLSTLTTVY